MNHFTPWLRNDGVSPISDSGPEEIIEITKGLQKAISKQADVFNPIVLVKISMPIPRKKAEISNIQRGMSNGNNNMK